MKKYLIQPMYHSDEPRWLTWEEAEEAAYWESLYFGLSLQGKFGFIYQTLAETTGFPTWTLYFANSRTVGFFVKCEGLV